MRHSLGRVVATAAVAASVPEAVIVGLLDRHVARDWGDLDAEDKASNDADHSYAEVGCSPVTTPSSTGPSG